MAISPSSWDAVTTMSSVATVMQGFSVSALRCPRGWFVQLCVFFECRGMLIHRSFRRFFGSILGTIRRLHPSLPTMIREIGAQDVALNLFQLWSSPRTTILVLLMIRLSLISADIYLKITEVFLQAFVHYFFRSFHIDWST